VGFVVDKVALGQVFSEYFGIPCQSSFHRLIHNHHRSSGAGTIGQLWPSYQVDSVSPHPEKLKKKVTNHVDLHFNDKQTYGKNKPVRFPLNGYSTFKQSVLFPVNGYSMFKKLVRLLLSEYSKFKQTARTAQLSAQVAKKLKETP
jgi:hypothetical protein